MSDLLTIGRSGVLAYKGALQTVGENVTNADTEGFARREVVLREQGVGSYPYTLNRTGSAFGGVQPAGVSRVWDQYKASNAWTANSDSSGASTRAQYLSTMESLLNDTDSGVGTRLTAIFTTATQLAANPADTSLRQAFLGSLSDVSETFHTTAANLTKLSGTIGTQASVLVDQSNDNLSALAKINLSLRSAASGSAGRAQLEDQRDSLLGALSGAMAIDTNFAADGSVTVRMNNNQGPLLVSNTDTTPSYVQMQTASDGRISMSVQKGTDVQAATPTGGALAGLVDGANTNAGRRQQLDGIASSLIGVMGDFQGAGLTDAGVVGGQLLDGTDAASIRLTTTDVTQIAAASTTGVANGNLLTLLGQRGANGVEQQWKTMVTDQSLQVSSAKIASSAASTRKDNAYTSLDETTGVDLDTEAAQLLRFQQAYSASAKIIQTARETLQDILNLF